MDSGIYVIASPSGKAYIGSSKRLEKRKKEHFRELSLGNHHCHALQKAYDKYKEKMTFVIIQYCEVSELIRNEQFWIDHSHFIWVEIYNSSMLADRIDFSTETRNRMRAAKIGKKLNLSKEQYEKRLRQLDDARSKRENKPPSEETKVKMSEAGKKAWQKKQKRAKTVNRRKA